MDKRIDAAEEPCRGRQAGEEDAEQQRLMGGVAGQGDVAGTDEAGDERGAADA